MAADHGEAISIYAQALLDTPLPWTKMRQVYRLLGLAGPAGDDQAPVTALPELPEEEELALAQMLEGFHNLLRYWHRCLAALSPHDPHEPHEPHEPHDPSEPLSRPGGATAPAAPTSGSDEGGGLGKRGSRSKNGD